MDDLYCALQAVAQERFSSSILSMTNRFECSLGMAELSTIFKFHPYQPTSSSLPLKTTQYESGIWMLSTRSNLAGPSSPDKATSNHY